VTRHGPGVLCVWIGIKKWGGSKATTSMSMRRRSSTSPGYLSIALAWQTAVRPAPIKGCWRQPIACSASKTICRSRS
jgi:hypothetical protein